MRFSEYGSPQSVLKMTQLHALDVALGSGDVAVKILASPINPSDINMVSALKFQKNSASIELSPSNLTKHLEIQNNSFHK